MKKALAIDFYRVVMPEEADCRFGEILERVSKLPADDKRNVVRFGYPLRLQDASLHGITWEGEFVRIRMDDLPVKASLAGELASLELDADEGIGEETAFLYDLDTEVLALQRNRTGASASAVCFYFERKGEFSGLHLDPVLMSDVLQRLAKLATTRRFEIGIAAPESLEVFRGQGKGVDALVNLAREFETPSAYVTLTMGHTKGSIPRAKEYAKKLLSVSSKSEGAVRKLRISGYGEGADEMEVLDLLEFRMKEEVVVNPGTDRRLSRSARQDALRRAFDKRASELRRMFRKP